MFFTWKTMTMTLFRLNRQSRSFLKQLANQIRANTMTIFEELEVNKKIEKIAVVKSSMNCTYPCVSWWIRRNICPYCWKHCDKRKQQPWIVAVYWSLERQMYCKYVNNQQREGPAVLDSINKIAVVLLSMNPTYLFFCRSRRRNVCPYCWKSMQCYQITTVNSRGLLVVRTTNLL